MLFQEPDWRFCWKCQGIFKGPDAAGVCPAGGHHDPSRGGEYVVFNETASVPLPAGEVWAEAPSQETGWRHCSRCEALFLSAAPGVCPAERGDHLADGSQYRLLYDGPYLHLMAAHYQLAWRRCVRCQSCYFSGNDSAGACPAGDEGHVPDGRDYALQAAGPLNDGVDAELLILAPPEFADAVLPLVEHRRRELTARLLTFDDELKSHYVGRDDAARLKSVIGYAAEYLRTRYVFLVGDGSMIPLRYRYSDHDGGDWEKGVRSVTDLYYANLYEDHAEAADGSVTYRGWSSWDANGDGFYNYQDWSRQTTAVDNPDRVDGYPDLAVGRLPAAGAEEVSAYVEKLLAYEDGTLAQGGGKLSLLGDGEYEDIVFCEGLIVRALSSTEWPVVDRIGFRYTDGATLPPGCRRAGDRDTPAAITEASSWIVYVGHGGADNWAIGWDAETARNLPPVGNAPIVVCVGCQTGQLATMVAAGPDPYVDTAGKTHWYWSLPPGSPHPTELVDFGAHDPDFGRGTPEQRWPAGPGGAIAPIAPEEPSVYQPHCQTIARQWLCSSPEAGAVAYVGEQTVAPNKWGSEMVAPMLAAAAAAAGSGQRLGDLWLMGCRNYWRNHRTDEDIIGCARIYLSYMTLYGDPSLRINA